MYYMGSIRELLISLIRVVEHDFMRSIRGL